MGPALTSLGEMLSCTKGMLSHLFIACDFTVWRSCKIGGAFQMENHFFIHFQPIKEILMAGASLEPKQILVYSAQ